MAQKEKQLLLKDLCARLPYGVMLSTPNGNKPLLALVSSKKYNTIIEYDDYCGNENNISEWEGGDVEFIKPYLRPMSSMTEEEVKDLLKVHIKTKYGEDSDYYNNLIRIERISKHYDNYWTVWIVFKSSYTEYKSTTCFIVGRVTWETTINEIDWLNAHHIDYRGLIPMGLALPAPEGMY